MPPGETHGLSAQQREHDRGVFLEPAVALVMRRRVAQRGEVAHEAAGDEVQCDLAAGEKGERGDGLGHGEGRRVDRLHGDERRQPARRAEDQLRHAPGIDEGVVGVDERAFGAGCLAPARHLGDSGRVVPGFVGARRWAGREQTGHAGLLSVGVPAGSRWVSTVMEVLRPARVLDREAGRPRSRFAT